MDCKSFWIKASAKCINVNVMCFMDYRPWNASLLVFCRLVDASKKKSLILKKSTSQLKSTNRDSPILILKASFSFPLKTKQRYLD